MIRIVIKTHKIKKIVYWSLFHFQAFNATELWMDSHNNGIVYVFLGIWKG